MEIDISWTPEHADVTGNEIVDRLVKEAAKEAEEVDENQDKAVTAVDIKQQRKALVRKSGKEDGT